MNKGHVLFNKLQRLFILFLLCLLFFACGNSILKDILEPLFLEERLCTEGGQRHIYGPWEVITHVDCITDGLEKRNCTLCNNSEQKRTITMLGHDWGPYAPNSGTTEIRICKRNPKHISDEHPNPDIGRYSVSTELQWDTAIINIKGSGLGKHYIEIEGEVDIPGTNTGMYDYTFGDKTGITVTIAGSTSSTTIPKLYLDSGHNFGNLLSINSGQSVVIQNLVLEGHSVNTNYSLINVYKGNFTLWDGAVVNGNTKDGEGGGIYVNEGSLTMNGGTISGNKVNGAGGAGVYLVGRATFFMNGGDIANNTANNTDSKGGGVFIAGNSIFNLNSPANTGSIFDNIAGSYSQVYVEDSRYGTFKVNGTLQNPGYN